MEESLVLDQIVLLDYLPELFFFIVLAFLLDFEFVRVLKDQIRVLRVVNNQLGDYFYSLGFFR